MARPDIKLGEKVFQPIQMGTWESAKANVLNGVYSLLADMIYTYHPQKVAEVDRMALAIFYGKEAAEAFDGMIDFAGRVKPTTENSPRSTLEIQMQERQYRGWRQPEIKIPFALQPIDLHRAIPYYVWDCGTNEGTRVLTPNL